MGAVTVMEAHRDLATYLDGLAESIAPFEGFAADSLRSAATRLRDGTLHFALKASVLTIVRNCGSGDWHFALRRAPVIDPEREAEAYAQELSNCTYSAITKIAERAEFTDVMRGNGHHFAQEMSSYVRDRFLERCRKS